MKKFFIVLVLVFLLGAAQTVQAEIMGITFSGTITRMMSGNPDAFEGIEVGSGFTGGFIYDSDAELVHESPSGSYAVYSGVGAFYWIDLGDFIVTAGADGITGMNVNDQNHAFLMEDWVPLVSNTNIVFDEAYIMFEDETGDVLSGLQLPPASSLAFTHAGFALTSFRYWDGYYTANIGGSFDEIHIIGAGTPVPEPATFLLLGLGMVVLALVSRKRVLNRV